MYSNLSIFFISSYFFLFSCIRFSHVQKPFNDATSTCIEYWPIQFTQQFCIGWDHSTNASDGVELDDSGRCVDCSRSSAIFLLRHHSDCVNTLWAYKTNTMTLATPDLTHDSTTYTLDFLTVLDNNCWSIYSMADDPCSIDDHSRTFPLII